MSRHHCALEPVNGGLRVRDEGSTNGVLLAGVRVFDAVVPGVAELRLGDTLLDVEPLPETVSREQATEDRFGDLLGSSARMRELFADLARIAPVDVTLLIEGETGTGKELVAECVHRESGRASGPFVVFDCSAIAPTLAESELFGHERGAFTGAVASRPGVFEQADGGTIFLDELGELPKELQPKLLRVLEKRQVRRLGSQRTIPVDVRLIAATNRNPRRRGGRRQFSRRPLLPRRGCARSRAAAPRQAGRSPAPHRTLLSRAKPPRTIAEVPEQVWEMFAAHRWPGNVRELGNAVQRLLVTPERALPAATTTSRPPPPDEVAVTVPLRIARREASDAFERSYLEALLERTAGNVTRAAAIAEVSRQMVQKLMRKHGIG